MKEQFGERKSAASDVEKEQTYLDDFRALSSLHSLILLLGANLGDRVLTFQQATQLLATQIGTVLQTSDLYETAPWGVIDQPAFLNQVLLLETNLTPELVLQQTQAIERTLGRIHREKWGARAIDIDILYYDHYVQQSDRLIIPHPYLHQRRFTLIPLAQIAPDFVHPVLQKTSTVLLTECADEGAVIRFDQGM